MSIQDSGDTRSSTAATLGRYTLDGVIAHAAHFLYTSQLENHDVLSGNSFLVDNVPGAPLLSRSTAGLVEVGSNSLLPS